MFRDRRFIPTRRLMISRGIWRGLHRRNPERATSLLEVPDLTGLRCPLGLQLTLQMLYLPLGPCPGEDQSMVHHLGLQLQGLLRASMMIGVVVRMVMVLNKMAGLDLDGGKVDLLVRILRGTYL